MVKQEQGHLEEGEAASTSSVLKIACFVDDETF